MKKLLAAAVNLCALVLVTVSLFLLSRNASGGNVFACLSQPDFIDSQSYEGLVSEAVTDIFEYIDLRDVFETNGKLDLNKVIAKADVSGTTVSYSLDTLIRYARSMGYYLNEKNEVVTGGTASVSETEDVLYSSIRVTYRAYMPDYKPASPTDGMTTIGKLSYEMLGYLAKYYSARSQFFDQPGNLKFIVAYADGTEETTYTNAPDMTRDSILSLGSFLATDSETLEIRSSLRTPPGNLVPLLTAHDPYEEGGYSLAIGVDTAFPARDSFSAASASYRGHRQNVVVALCLLGLGVLLFGLSFSALLTLCTTITARPHPIDRLPAELLALLFLLWLRGADALSAALLDAASEIIGIIDAFSFWTGILAFLLKYLLFLPLCLSLARSYRNDSLWEKSLSCRLLTALKRYLEAAALALPRLYSTLLFLLPNAAGLLLIVMLYVRFFRYQSLFSFLTATLLLAILICIDCYSYRIAAGLQQAVNEQVKSERLKADLITNVSHDLKTPLTSIINYVDLMKREEITNPKLKQYLEVLDQKSNRLKTLTEDLVEASKASSGNVNIEFMQLDYSEMVQQALGEFEDKLQAAKLEIIPSFPAQPALIMADGRHLWRVIENLLNNCCKYALRGSRVYVEVTETEDNVACTIKNISASPLNISPEELTERFVRGDVSRTTEGSGLGLSIAKSLTTLMKGHLEITIDGDLYKAAVIFPRVQKQNDTASRKDSV